MKRAVFFVSDSTGITVEALGCSVLSQFDSVEFSQQILAFVDTADKAAAAAEQIRQAATTTDGRPIIFYIFADESLAEPMKNIGALLMDCLEIFPMVVE